MFWDQRWGLEWDHLVNIYTAIGLKHPQYLENWNGMLKLIQLFREDEIISNTSKIMSHYHLRVGVVGYWPMIWIDCIGRDVYRIEFLHEQETVGIDEVISRVKFYLDKSLINEINK